MSVRRQSVRQCVAHCQRISLRTGAEKNTGTPRDSKSRSRLASACLLALLAIVSTSLLHVEAQAIPAGATGVASGDTAAAEMKSASIYDQDIRHLILNTYRPSLAAYANESFVVPGFGEALLETLPSGYKLSHQGQAVKIPAEGGLVEFPLNAPRDLEASARRRYFVAPDLAGRLHFRPASGKRCTIHGTTYIFIDENMNGSAFDSGIDSVALGRSATYAMPLVFPMMTPSGLLELEPAIVDEKEVMRYRLTKVNLRGQDKEVYETLLAIRAQFGLLLPTHNDEWAKHCKSHCEYMLKNDDFGHYQDPNKPGYSKEGAVAGVTSVLAKGRGKASDSVFSLWDTPLHGFMLRCPDLAQVAVARHDEYTAIRIRGDEVSVPQRRNAWSFPVNNAINVPTSWTGKESPNPLMEDGKGIGYPITLHLRQEWNDVPVGSNNLKSISTGRIPRAPIVLQFLLQAAGKDEESGNPTWVDVPCQVTYNAATAPMDMLNKGVLMAFALPLEALAENTVHRYHLRWTWDVAAGAQPGVREGDPRPDAQDEAAESPDNGEDRPDSTIWHEYRACFRTGEERGGHEWATDQSLETRKRVLSARTSRRR